MAHSSDAMYTVMASVEQYLHEEKHVYKQALSIQYRLQDVIERLVSYKYDANNSVNAQTHFYEEMKWSSFTGSYESSYTLNKCVVEHVLKLKKNLRVIGTRIHSILGAELDIEFHNIEKLQTTLATISHFLNHVLSVELEEHVYKTYTQHFVYSEDNGSDVFFNDLNQKLDHLDDLIVRTVECVMRLDLASF